MICLDNVLVLVECELGGDGTKVFEDLANFRFIFRCRGVARDRRLKALKHSGDIADEDRDWNHVG